LPTPAFPQSRKTREVMGGRTSSLREAAVVVIGAVVLDRPKT